MALQNSQIFISVILLILSTHGIIARQDYGPFMRRLEVPPAGNDDYENSSEELYSEMKKYSDQDPNFLPKWPYLRELMPEYEGSSTNQDKLYVEIPEPLLPMALRRNRPTVHANENVIKEQHQKKNSNSRKGYMSACHFKICNMGRKRNARFAHQVPL